jgi:XRE family transcriptional regulator, aerobic/anaerobic benzoate catabolism transcriptional regulator
MSRAAVRSEGQVLLGNLARVVRTLRHQQGLTLKNLAEKSSLSLRFVSGVESGKANISVLNLAQLAAALGVAPADLLESPETTPNSSKVVALLGLRGAGKSTIGAALAKRLGTKFFELDRLIESEAGMSLSEIFAMHGDEYFRRAELAALRRFFEQHSEGVLATSGGLVTADESFALLRAKAQTVWLKASAEEHWQRVVGQGDLRPMQNRPHAMAELRRRLKEREPLYRLANLTVMTSRKTTSEATRDIEAGLTKLATGLQR